MKLWNARFASLAAVFMIAVVIDLSPSKSTEKVMGNWPVSTPEQQGMDSKVLAEMLGYLEHLERVDNVTIVRNGHMVLNANFYPFAIGSKHHIYSCTKSVTSALIGIAISQGHIGDLDTPVLSYFPDRQVKNLDNRKKNFSLKDLLTMSTGLRCDDSWRHRWVGLSKMLRSSDWLQYVLDLPMKANPGETFEYCNAATFLLAAILEKSTGVSTVEFARQNLFHPLGIRDFKWEVSPKGIASGYANLWLTPPDMAKFGWLFLNKGKWGQKQIVPASWVEESTRAHVKADVMSHYGYQWWREDNEGYFAALGARGQYIVVVPELNLVAVFTNDFAGADFNIPKYILREFVLRAVKSDDALPPNKGQLEKINALIAKVSRGPDLGDTWKSEGDGIAKDGRFVRTTAPSFEFRFPEGSRKEELQTKSQVMRMKTPSAHGFSASVSDHPDGVSLAQLGPRIYIEWLRDAGNYAKLVSNTPIKLRDGSDAYRTVVDWSFRNIRLQSYAVSALKNSKWILVQAHAFRRPDIAKVIVESLELKTVN